ncbi:3-hydroxybutyrate oligomer hydrolase family protein [Orbus sturtevantii]|uniref:3-hydroxybutyrate oligomer hydrolase family protein n=1 Tax=Orbus sturtevantii TaxID=3074109 RepID=UPI00370D72C6
MFNIKNIFIFVAFCLLTTLSYSLSYANESLLKKKYKNLSFNIKPNWLHINNSYFYDGETDDLVTAGYGFTKLSQFKVKSIFRDVHNPTTVEFKRARLNRYIDTKSGEGRFFGFNKQNLTPLFDGRVAGTEIQARLNNGDEKVDFLLQIPLDFDTKRPCIIAIPTTGSEGVYNAKDIQVRGLWGLNRNCAVVYNDKGLGNLLFDLSNEKNYLANDRILTESAVNKERLFNINLDKKTTEQFNHRYAIRQLYSQQNPEAKWGEYVLNSIEFAFYEINELFASNRELMFDKNNTLILVYGESDGGGAALKAGELDKDGVIDGIVAVNPQVQIADNTGSLFIQNGQSNAKPLIVKSLIDYSSYGALYIPCAIAAIKNDLAKNTIPELASFFFAENRCLALRKAGLLSQDTINEQAKEALNKLYEYGLSPNMIAQLPYYYATQSINYPYKYISEYGRYGIADHLCHYSIASIEQNELLNEGTVSGLGEISFALLLAKNNGSLPIKLDSKLIVMDLVNDDDPNGPRREFYSRSKESTTIDYNLSGAICLREKIFDKRVKDGLSEVLANGNLNNIKTIIVHGQLNIKNLPNYSARAYVALNSLLEGEGSNLTYIEVENASYIDSVPPFDNILLPIDYYGESAMNWLWNSLTHQALLPESQVIRTKIRGGNSGFAPAINYSNLATIEQKPKKENRIEAKNGTVILPNN